MKKKDLILDFSSLLDVIMIILFVVISSVGQASIDAKEELKVKSEENKTVKEALEEQKVEEGRLKEKNQLALAELEKMKQEVERLNKDNSLLKEASVKNDMGVNKMYENILKKSVKFTLVCTPFVGSTDQEKDEVEIKLYSGQGGREQEELSSIIIEHDFSLTAEERNFKNSRMKEELYRILDRNIKNSDTELLLFTVQFTYEDRNFSQSDLDIIEGAIKDLERRKKMTCYIDRLRQ